MTSNADRFFNHPRAQKSRAGPKVHTTYLARHHFTIARKMRGSIELKQRSHPPAKAIIVLLHSLKRVPRSDLD